MDGLINIPWASPQHCSDWLCLSPSDRPSHSTCIPQWDRSIEMTVGIAMASGTEIYTIVGHPALTRRSVAPGLEVQGRRVSEMRCSPGVGCGEDEHK